MLDEDRKAALLRRYSVALMNDTKWREVWSCLTRRCVKFSIAFALDDQWNSANAQRVHFPLREELVGEHGLRDPGVGGPVLYRDILWVRVSRTQNSNFDDMVQDLAQLGQLPVVTVSDGIEVRGYRK